ncbi:MAG: L,D-transpeptidase family protein [Hahellaceae bacterium]|nr:L,D-transpeptidase family protein [Hahellaceae bacterium]
MTATQAHSKDYLLHGNSDLVGNSLVIRASEKDTLADLAEQHNVGFLAIKQANPEVDAWLPGEQSQVLIPTEHILPSKRKGLVVNLDEFRLYYFPPKGGKVQTYPIGIGRDETPSPLVATKTKTIVAKPNWYPTKETRERYQKEGITLPTIVKAGPDNPLGNFAIQLEIPSYFIHGTNKPFGIGTKVSSGCIRMYNWDIAELVKHLPKGTPTFFIRESIKVGVASGQVFAELHPNNRYGTQQKREIEIINQIIKLEEQVGSIELDPAAVSRAVKAPLGVPQRIGELKSSSERMITLTTQATNRS